MQDSKVHPVSDEGEGEALISAGTTMPKDNDESGDTAAGPGVEESIHETELVQLDISQVGSASQT